MTPLTDAAAKRRGQDFLAAGVVILGLAFFVSAVVEVVG